MLINSGLLLQIKITNNPLFGQLYISDIGNNNKKSIDIEFKDIVR